jgi:hypothetical protein
MSVEKITHGNPFVGYPHGNQSFPLGWTQNGNQFFIRTGDIVRYLADEPSTEGTARIFQFFSMSGMAITALFNLHLHVSVGTADEADGHANINAILVKPDDSEVILYNGEFTDGQEYNGQACSDLDISSYMDQVGTYYLKISSENACSWSVPVDVPVYEDTEVEIGGVSLKVTEKLTKVVLEKIGGGEIGIPQVGQGALEGAVLAESLAHTGGYQPGTDSMPTVVKHEKAGFQEFTAVSVGAGSLEGAGLAESLERTYNYRKHDLPGMPEGARLAESLTAKWQDGNVTRWRYIEDEISIWTERVPVSTNWEA